MKELGMKNFALSLLSLFFLSACDHMNLKKHKELDEDAPVNTMKFENENDVILNLDQIISRYNLKSDTTTMHLKAVKIAIFDNGFSGLTRAKGTTLPENTKIIHNSNKAMSDSSHGTKMAEIVYSVATKSNYWSPNTVGPDLYLFNTNGFSNLKDSIQKAIDLDIDLILYSQVWEYGGNFDGSGFINLEVNKALEAGIVWVNAAGNYGQSIWRGQLESNNKKEVKLPSSSNSVQIRVLENDTDVKIVLAWNDFKNDSNYATSQDLDLYLEDEFGDRIEDSKKNQTGTKQADDDSYSAHAREIIHTRLDQGSYHLKVKMKSNNFNTNSQLQLSVQGYKVSMLEYSPKNSILIPADNPGVLTIGANDQFETSESLLKPEVSIPSKLEFSKGGSYIGTSIAAAIAAGVLTNKWQENNNKNDMIRLLNQ